MKLQKLPVGDSSFESIRSGNCVYVDKTRHIFQMLDEGKFYFMSRPRRFGKSLMVSTLECLFKAKKKLFDGLWISENSDWEWKPHPVIFLDFNGISHDTPENLKISLERRLQKIAANYEITSDAPLIKDQFKELIIDLYDKTGECVVVLMDEYDKPLIDHLGKGAEAVEIAKANRDILKYVLGVLKDGSVTPKLKLVFITGVSKFSRVSIFSELNNLSDLTMNREYTDMLGYTKDEIQKYLAGHIGRFADATEQTPGQVMEAFRAYYDGYRFSEKDTRMYNPFSVLCALNDLSLKNYWFETGTPTFLVNLLAERNFPLANIENLRLDEQTFSVYDIERLQPEALLFQTGYITIKNVIKFEDSHEKLYAFHYPNQEVRISFLKFLMFSHIPGNGDYIYKVFQLSGMLYREQYDQFFGNIKSIFASIPYELESKRDEAYFHTAFYLILNTSGTDTQNEVLTCKGRIDMVVEYPDKIFIIEFKCNQSAQKGVDQIIKKKYADKYLQSGKKMILMGINFDSQKRNVSEWKIGNA